MNLKAIRIKQDGQTLYVAAFPAGELIARSKPDIFRDENGNEHGYQRAPERPRALAMARFLRSNQVLLPNAITLAARVQLPYDKNSGTLTIPDAVDLFEVDGQHRLAGFRVAINEQGIQHLFEYPLVTVIIDNSNEILEAEQFKIINETSKKVRTDLARKILARMAHKLKFPFRRIPIERKWEVRATEIINLIKNDAESAFFQRIQSPNQKKSDLHIIKEQSFGDSLKPLLTSHPFENYSSEAIAKGLKEFWEAWRQIMDEATDFDKSPFSNPKEFVMLKAIPGVFALHLVCRYLWSVFERQRLQFRSGEIALALKEAGEKVQDSDENFTMRLPWYGENNRGFGLFGGLKGAKGLAELIIEYLKEAGYSLDASE